MKYPIRPIAVTALVALLASCGPMGPNPSNSSRAQFVDSVWVSPDVQGKSLAAKYKTVYFAPTYTGYLKKQGWWAAQNSKTQDDLEKDSRYLGRYFHDELVSSAHNYPGKRLRVVTVPQADSLIIETAITELTPSKAYWNTAATAAGFVVPGAGLLGIAGKGSIGIEGRMRDGRTGAVVAEFQDSMKDKTAAVNLGAYKWYGGTKSNLKEFSLKTAKFLNTEPGTVINSSAPIKLIAF
jgi:Protein of unknown function (DUF3313)